MRRWEHWKQPAWRDGRPEVSQGDLDTRISATHPFSWPEGLTWTAQECSRRCRTRAIVGSLSLENRWQRVGLWGSSTASSGALLLIAGLGAFCRGKLRRPIVTQLPSAVSGWSFACDWSAIGLWNRNYFKLSQFEYCIRPVYFNGATGWLST